VPFHLCRLGRSLFSAPLEQVRVRSGADQVQIVTFDSVDQEPIGFDVAVMIVLPVPAKWMVSVPGRQGLSFCQEQAQLAQLR
jgi:hypothetical protein